jgi:hypothetical protein
MKPTVVPGSGASRAPADRLLERCSITWGECLDFPGFSHVCRLTPPDHVQPHRCVCGEAEQ